MFLVLFRQIVTTMTLMFLTIIMSLPGLSLLTRRAGLPPEWGAMMNDGRTYIQEAPWIVSLLASSNWDHFIASKIGDALSNLCEPKSTADSTGLLGSI